MKDPSSGYPLTSKRLTYIVLSSLVGFFSGMVALKVMESKFGKY